MDDEKEAGSAEGDRTRTLVIVFGVVALSLMVTWGLGADSAGGAGPSQAEVDELGAALYGRDCSYCHGARGQGSPRGIAIADVGEASAHYSLVTGRMPLDDPDDVPRRGTTSYTDEEIDALVDHVAALGTGPPLPNVDWESADVAQGGRLYRLHCGACHGSTARGGALAYDRFAPGLMESEPSVVAAAVVAGPGAMPAFGPDGFTDDELAQIVAYVQRLREPEDRGGWPIFRAGRADEALVALGIALPVLVVATAWIARRPDPGDET